MKSNPIWTTEFSKDGKYLAVAGKDQIIRIYHVISTHKEREDHEKEEDASSLDALSERISAPVFRTKPVREFHGRMY
jgi:WD40 repeat protein